MESATGLLLILGAMIGTQINRGIYRLAWSPRSIGPWSHPHMQAPPRRWSDCLPIIGWVGMRRESSVHGSGFWIRPMLIELTCAVGLAALYRWELSGGLYETGIELDTRIIHYQFLSHVVLLVMMLTAAFIDIDEKTIPDSITVPGTLLGLLLVAVFPSSLLPASVLSATANAPVSSSPVLVTTPLFWPEVLDSWNGLLAGIGCFAAWCFAIAPRTWWTRSGWKRAFQFLWASVLRAPQSRFILLLFLVGAICIGQVWSQGGMRWQCLLSALVGSFFGGGLVWAVRFLAGATLGKEAMGFGDVTLMAMIGTFVGWQGALLVFFIAPFAGSVIAIAQWLVTRRHDIPFGPFLCVSALTLILRWPTLWNQWAGEFFILGWFIPICVLFCLVLMAGMLLLLKGIQNLIQGPES